MEEKRSLCASLRHMSASGCSCSCDTALTCSPSSSAEDQIHSKAWSWCLRQWSDLTQTGQEIPNWNPWIGSAQWVAAHYLPDLRRYNLQGCSTACRRLQTKAGSWEEAKTKKKVACSLYMTELYCLWYCLMLSGKQLENLWNEVLWCRC